MTKEIKIVISAGEDGEKERRAIMNRYENIFKLNQIYNHASSILKHGKDSDYKEALKDILDISLIQE